MLIEFDIPSPVDVRTLNIFVRALCAYNVLWLQRHPETPNVYESGIRYGNQPLGVERFKPIPLLLRESFADCDQLAPWRAAEIRVREHVKALPEVKQFGPSLFHVFVRYPGGKAEDVSAHLGMRIPPKLAAAGRRLLEKNSAPPRSTLVAASGFRSRWQTA
jgi:hypothetical protein